MLFSELLKEERDEGRREGHKEARQSHQKKCTQGINHRQFLWVPDI